MDGAADRLAAQGLHVLTVGVDGDLHQPAGGKVQALVHIHGAGHAIGTGHLHALEHIRAVFFGQAAGGSLHHTVEHAVGFLASQNGHRLVVHTQQQGDHLPHSAAVEGREDRCRCRGSQRVAGACHCHTGGGAGAGRDRRDAARRLVGVDPDRSGAGAVIVDIVGVQSGICGHGIIAVDRRRDKGQLGGAIGHKGALHTAEQH